MVSSVDFLTSSLAPAIVLTFNPIKLLLLIGWVYLCLYCVQCISINPLVPTRHKSLASIVTIFTGPILLFVLSVNNMITKYSKGDYTFTELITEQMEPVFAVLKSLGLMRSTKYSTIKLFDSSRNPLREVYRHTTNERDNNYVYQLTKTAN